LLAIAKNRPISYLRVLVKTPWFFGILVELGWEFRFSVPISGTPIGSRIPIPCPIPDIPVRIFV
jgi:hypothetical protein